MILSLISLDLSSPSVRQSLKNCEDMHRSLMKAFDRNRNEAKVLYRIIRSEKNVQIYVQSNDIPNWARIDEKGYHCVKMKDISELLSSFRDQQMLHFSLLGVPSKKVAGEGKNSKRIVLRGEEQQLDWLKRQGEKGGFCIKEAHITAKTELISGQKKSGHLYLAAIPFEGTLQITNLQLFTENFQNGIGAEKAYGCGMLMVGKANGY